MTIAKFRVTRRLWARVAEVVGEPDAGAARVHAVTSMPMMAQRDPWVNMLRTTVAAFGAGVGGADTVLVQPFDAAIPGGLPGTAAGFARRIARNTQLLLLEESHLGRVLDPAGGFLVRRGPHRTARRAGVGTLPADRVARRLRRGRATSSPPQIAEVRDRRTDDINHRRTALTGVNEYPNLDESPLPHRDSPATGPAIRRRVRGVARSLRRLPGEDRVAAESAAAAAGSARRAQHPHDVRRQSARLRRDRGRQSGRRRGRGCGRRGFGRRRPRRRGDLRDRRPLRNRSGGRGRGRAQGRGVARPAGRAGEGRRRAPIRSPTTT